MKPKHTPGPWLASHIGSYYCISSGEVLIARVEQQRARLHKMRGPENQEADGDLLAAAPDLLSALKDAASALALCAEAEREIGSIGEYSASFIKPIKQAIRAANLAISKAVGE